MGNDPVKILIVDDEDIVCRRLGKALMKNGWSCETFTSAAAGLARLEEERFDVVVTDVRIGEEDGIELFETVNERWPETKVVVMTGYATLELAREALTKGAFEFVAKPFTPKEMRNVIQRALKA